MKTLTPIVGINFRPPEVKTLFAELPVGTPLVLDPEPDNPFDPEAIRVCIIDDDYKLSTDNLIHIGYVPRSGAKTDTLKCGNKEVFSIMCRSVDWKASLTFSPSGTPLVEIIYND